MFTAFHLFSEESEILCYSPATKLAKNSFIAAARRHETPGSEIKAFITQDGNRHLLPVPCGGKTWGRVEMEQETSEEAAAAMAGVVSGHTSEWALHIF